MRSPDPPSSASDTPPATTASTLRWFRNPSPPSPTSCVPVVVILTWIQGKPDIVRKYVDLYIHGGCDVAVFHTPALAMWFPSWATKSATAILTELNKELNSTGPRPLVFSVFSGATKAVYYKLLQQLAPAPLASEQHGHLQPPGGQAAPPGPPASTARWIPWPASRSPPTPSLPRFPQVQRCFSAQVFDSSPVDFTSNMGVELLTPSSSPPTASRPGPAAAPLPAPASATAAARRLAANLAAGTLDFMLIDWFEKQREEMWSSLKRLAADTRHPTPSAAASSSSSSSVPSQSPYTLLHSTAAVPTLFLYSWNDPLADPLRIHQLAAALRARGGLVLEQAWQESEHVGHLRVHGAQYGSLVEELLRRVRQDWEQQRTGRAAAAEQQQQQQQQQEQSCVWSQSGEQGQQLHIQEQRPDNPGAPQAPCCAAQPPVEGRPSGGQGQQHVAPHVARLAGLNAARIAERTQALHELHGGMSLSPVNGGRQRLRSKL